MEHVVEAIFHSAIRFKFRSCAKARYVLWQRTNFCQSLILCDDSISRAGFVQFLLERDHVCWMASNLKRWRKRASSPKRMQYNDAWFIRVDLREETRFWGRLQSSDYFHISLRRGFCCVTLNSGFKSQWLVLFSTQLNLQSTRGESKASH